MSRLIAFIIFSYCTQSSAVSFDGSIDLSNQFSPIVNKQIGGSCHVYSEAALVEAACYQITHKHINLSEGKLFEQHLIDQMKKYEESSIKPSDPTRTPGVNIISGHVDGSPKAGKTLKRILNGEACTEQEFTSNRKTYQDIQNMIEGLQKFNDDDKFQIASSQARSENEKAFEKQEELKRLKLLHEKSLEELKKFSITSITTPEVLLGSLLLKLKILQEERQIKKLQQYLNENIDRTIEHESQIITQQEKITYDQILKNLKEDLAKAPQKTKSNDLSKCLEKIHPFKSSSKASNPMIMDLLNKKLPVLCSGFIEGFPHETLIVGYRYSADKKLEYLFHDSVKGLVWGLKAECEEILWIPNG